MYIFPYERHMFDNYRAYRLSKLVKCAVPPVLLAVGTAGNLLGMAVLRRHSKSVPVYLYLILIAITDQLVLSTALLWKWLKEMFGIRLETVSDLSCKLTSYLQFSFSYASVWLIVAMTIERFYAVAFPLRASTSAHGGRRIRATALAICLLDLALNSHWMWTVALQPKRTNYSTAELGEEVSEFAYHDCDLRPSLGIAYAIYWADTVCYLLTPFGVILLLNIAIVVQLLRPSCLNSTASGGGHRQLPPPPLNSPRSRSARQVTVMLSTICACYLLCTLPIATLKLSIFLFDLTRSSDLASIANFYLVEAVSEMIMYLSHVANFFLYVASAQRFRRELRQALGCCRSAAAPVAAATVPAVAGDRRQSRPTYLERRSTKTVQLELATIRASVPLLNQRC